VSALKAAQPSASISYILMDLANLQSVRDAAAAWLDSGKQIDVLLNNAGVWGFGGGGGSEGVSEKEGGVTARQQLSLQCVQ
jgi:NAD(P)-dependent dehydrogenase (short-subunit alcohol dehydrogenase family)